MSARRRPSARATPPAPTSDPAPLRLLDALAARPRRIVALAAAIPFLVTLGNPPILDDGWTALDNPLTWDLRNVPRIFTELYGYAGPASVRGPYRPVTTLTYALDHAVHGRWPPGFHAVNVALHVLASLLVLALARRLARAAAPALAPRLALLAGLVFAVHPAHVEAVASIFGRTEPLSACFALGSLILALDRARSGWRLPAAVLLLAAGVLSKETAIVTAVLYALLAWAVPGAAGLAAPPGLTTAPGRRSLAAAAGVSALLLVAVAPYFLLRPNGLDVAVRPEARWFPVGTPAADIARTMSRVLGEYLRILAWPDFLGGDFAYAARLPTLRAATPGLVVATVAWAAVLAVALWLWSTRRTPLGALCGAGLLCTFVPLLPVLQIVPVGVLLAERLLYLPSVGFCLFAATVLAGATARARGPWRAWAAALALAVPALLAARTVVRTLDWRSAAAFWGSELEKAPRETVVNNNLAVALTADADRASPAEREALLARAEERLLVTLEVNPSYWRAWVNLGIARAKGGRFAPAQEAFTAASRLAPAEPSPHFWAAWTLEQAGRGDEAVREYREAARLAPEDIQAPLYLGRLLAKLGRVDEARAELERAAVRAPHDADVQQALRALPPR